MYEVQALLLPSVVMILFICQMYLWVFGWLVVFKRDALIFRGGIESPVALRSTG